VGILFFPTFAAEYRVAVVRRRGEDPAGIEAARTVVTVVFMTRDLFAKGSAMEPRE
jgi:hypothetical protein